MTQWTPEHIDQLRNEGRPLRLAFARQTPEEKAEQRAQMRESLTPQQVEHVLPIWQEFAQAVRTLRQAIEELHASLAQQVRPLDNHDQHDQKDKARIQSEPPPASGRT